MNNVFHVIDIFPSFKTTTYRPHTLIHEHPRFIFFLYYCCENAPKTSHRLIDSLPSLNTTRKSRIDYCLNFFFTTILNPSHSALLEELAFFFPILKFLNYHINACFINGFTGLDGPINGKKTARFKPSCMFEHDKSVIYGTLYIHENPGCLVIATNKDAVGHMTNLEDAGCMVATICGSTEKDPIVVGKPYPFMMEFLLQNCSRMCMVGDRLDTDILFGQNAGVTTLPNLQDPSNMIQPDYYTSKVSEILEL
ncbi:hypothetical protein UlMin_003451 [Ulmus minor]